MTTRSKLHLFLMPNEKSLFRRYWKSASSFWRGRTGLIAWSLLGFLIVLLLSQLLVQYLINFWNRDFFNALEKRDVSLLWAQAHKFLPLAMSSILIAILNVWGKMTLQRTWRERLSKDLIHYWLKDDHYRRLKEINKFQLNAEYRIAEDARIATDLPIDLLLGFLTSVLTALAFISVLWEVGGNFDVNILGYDFYIPGYLVISAMVYSILLTGSMIIFGRHLTKAVEGKNHSEADLRGASSKLRGHGDQKIKSDIEIKEGKDVETMLERVIESWRVLCWQLMRTTFISHGNGLIAPIVGLLLCTPNYLAGVMSLGQVVQAAAAFVTVQSCFNWLLDNFPRIADWLSSANRVALLLQSLDDIEGKKDKLV